VIKKAPTYAHAGGPPHDWQDLKVWDIVQEAYVQDVVEVNAAEGWLIKYELGLDGKPIVEGEGNDRRFRRIRCTGKFQLRYAVPKR